jgi:hypothetical protein
VRFTYRSPHDSAGKRQATRRDSRPGHRAVRVERGVWIDAQRLGGGRVHHQFTGDGGHRTVLSTHVAVASVSVGTAGNRIRHVGRVVPVDGRIAVNKR